MRLLVTGGAGYIGSVVAALLLGRGHDVTVLDSLERGHRAAVPAGAGIVQADLRDPGALEQAIEPGYDAALHFAALALVGESVEHPERYWATNVGGTRNLLDRLRETQTPRLVFSSTCATYGVPDKLPMDEDTPTRPQSPYGTSKLAVDLMIGDECRAHGLNAVSLRYFNVAGATGGLGEDHNPETHLIPNVLLAAMGELSHVELLGTDYPTRDGTAIRDYVHVEDLAEAHLRALEGGAAGQHRIFNLGNGSGFSVRQVIQTACEVTGIDIPVHEASRRPGDPPELVAAGDKIRAELGWEPRKDLEAILEDAWTWHQAHPSGYADLELSSDRPVAERSPDG